MGRVPRLRTRGGASLINDVCDCCFIEAAEGTMHPGEVSYKVGEHRAVTQVIVCAACRRLGCEVQNPEGYKRPEAAGVVLDEREHLASFLANF
mgnify:CR=1 FL=1